MKIEEFLKSGESKTLEFKEKFNDRNVETAVDFASSILQELQ